MGLEGSSGPRSGRLSKLLGSFGRRQGKEQSGGKNARSAPAESSASRRRASCSVDVELEGQRSSGAQRSRPRLQQRKSTFGEAVTAGGGFAYGGGGSFDAYPAPLMANGALEVQASSTPEQSRPKLQRKTTYQDAVSIGGGFAYGGGGSFDVYPAPLMATGALGAQASSTPERTRPKLQRKTTYIDAIKDGGGFSYGGGGPFDMHPGYLAPSGGLYQAQDQSFVGSTSRADHLEQVESSSRRQGKQRRSSVSGAASIAAARSEAPAAAPERTKSTRRNSTSSSIPPHHYIHPVTKRLIPPHPNSNAVKSDHHRGPRERYSDHIKYTEAYPETLWGKAKEGIPGEPPQHVSTSSPKPFKRHSLLGKRRDSVSSTTPRTVAAAAVEMLMGPQRRGRAISVSGVPTSHPVYPSQPFYPTGEESKKKHRRRSADSRSEAAVPKPVAMPPARTAEPSGFKKRSHSRARRPGVSSPERRGLSTSSTASASAYGSDAPLARQVAHTSSSSGGSRHGVYYVSSKQQRGDADYSLPMTGSGVRSGSQHRGGGSGYSSSTGITGQGWGAKDGNGLMLSSGTMQQSQYLGAGGGIGDRCSRSRSRSVSRSDGGSHEVGRRGYMGEDYRW